MATVSLADSVGVLDGRWLTAHVSTERCRLHENADTVRPSRGTGRTAAGRPSPPRRSHGERGSSQPVTGHERHSHAADRAHAPADETVGSGQGQNGAVMLCGRQWLAQVFRSRNFEGARALRYSLGRRNEAIWPPQSLVGAFPGHPAVVSGSRSSAVSGPGSVARSRRLDTEEQGVHMVLHSVGTRTVA
jgi:hypothetical protein